MPVIILLKMSQLQSMEKSQELDEALIILKKHFNSFSSNDLPFYIYLLHWLQNIGKMHDGIQMFTSICLIYIEAMDNSTLSDVCNSFAKR